MKPMKLTWTKITPHTYKFFYDGYGYGEFYLDINDDKTAMLSMKDPDYGKALIDGFYAALVKED